MEIAIGLAIAWVAMVGLGAFIATVKRRPLPEGFILGLIFGPFGCLIEALLPTNPVDTPAPRKTRPSGWQAPKDDKEEDAAAAFLGLNDRPR